MLLVDLLIMKALDKDEKGEFKAFKLEDKFALRKKQIQMLFLTNCK